MFAWAEGARWCQKSRLLDCWKWATCCKAINWFVELNKRLAAAVPPAPPLAFPAQHPPPVKLMSGRATGVEAWDKASDDSCML